MRTRPIYDASSGAPPLFCDVNIPVLNIIKEFVKVGKSQNACVKELRYQRETKKITVSFNSERETLRKSSIVLDRKRAEKDVYYTDTCSTLQKTKLKPPMKKVIGRTKQHLLNQADDHVQHKETIMLNIGQTFQRIITSMSFDEERLPVVMELLNKYRPNNTISLKINHQEADNGAATPNNNNNDVSVNENNDVPGYDNNTLPKNNANDNNNDPNNSLHLKYDPQNNVV
ncbi:hypothetical protein TSAR_012714 [Trichomalopsis sarcophagae]|uniref:Uncharacterized protein n=1 Tax=Trichomalopsis sarcophagae TaxID=543379 RepID=A0A232FI78_9HYME|nr:hypothetical protein TSAR_012714 [Trichomalopsis sarcophagae]